MMAISNPRSSTGTIGLCLEPLDVLFFRGGRPFTPASRGRSGLPSPQTLAGAIRTRLLEQMGCDFDHLSHEVRSGGDLEAALDSVCGAGWVARVLVRGPWFARRSANRDDDIGVLVPAPATLRRPKGWTASNGPQAEQLLRLDPLSPHRELPGWNPEFPGMRPLWLRRPVHVERTAGYLTPEGLGHFLAGGVLNYLRW